MKIITGESFEVRLEEQTSTVHFKGALRLTNSEDYAPILELLEETLSNGSQMIVVDIRELDFLNSSGITMLSRFVIEVRGRMMAELRFLASKNISWHARSLTNLQRLMPALTISLV